MWPEQLSYRLSLGLGALAVLILGPLGLGAVLAVFVGVRAWLRSGGDGGPWVFALLCAGCVALATLLLVVRASWRLHRIFRHAVQGGTVVAVASWRRSTLYYLLLLFTVLTLLGLVRGQPYSGALDRLMLPILATLTAQVCVCLAGWRRFRPAR